MESELITKELIILRSVYPKNGIKIYTNPVKDPKTNRFPPCVKPVNSNNDIIMTDAEKNSGEYFIKETDVFILQDGTVFDLSDEIQAKQWEAVKNNELIANSRDARDAQGNLIIDGGKSRYGKAELYIERPGYESKKKVDKKRLVSDAFVHIFSDTLDGMITKCKLLGKHMRNVPSADVTDYLISVAEKFPEKIINLYTGGDTKLRLLLIDAKDKHVIRVKDKLYVYGDNIALGATDDAVITWMKQAKNRSLLLLIEKDTYPDFYPDETTDSLNDTIGKDKKQK